jgi:hypothetical protein
MSSVAIADAAAAALAGLAAPDFSGHSLLNLAATVETAVAGAAPYPLLADARLREPLLAAPHLVLWLIDGLGVEPLQQLVPGGALAGALRGELQTVYPSSTAPVLTLLATARSPAAHAVPEWFVWFDELGGVYSTLPLLARPAGGSLPAVSDAAGLYPQPSLAMRARRPCHAVLPAALADTTYSRYAHAGARRLPFGDDDGFVAAVCAAVDDSPRGSYVFAYSDAFDATAHEFGVGSDRAAAVARRLDLAFERLSAQLARRGALLAVTADHGFIDVPPVHRFRLEALPEIAACLQRPLCGGPRAPIVHVREDRRDEFPARVEAALGAHFAAVPSAALLAAGWLGPETPHPRLPPRLGTHVLLPKSDAFLIDVLPGERPPKLVGMHGGLSSAERRVPLVFGGAAP